MKLHLKACPAHSMEELMNITLELVRKTDGMAAASNSVIYETILYGSGNISYDSRAGVLGT
jgi:hypothetical protein